jgi:hypothetical protein
LVDEIGQRVDIPDNQLDDDSQYKDDPAYEKITTQQSLILRVRNITPATYQYYRTLSLQYTENMFNEQPVTIAGNIENGYGSFVVYNAAYITLLEWETSEYGKIEE